MLKRKYPLYLGNQPLETGKTLPVMDKYNKEQVAEVSLADRTTIERAIALAVDAAEPMRKLPSFERQRILSHCVSEFLKRSEELAMALTLEAGKPIKDSRGEVGRLIDTFRIAAEESTRNYGEVIPMDISPRTQGYSGMWKRVPIGPCSFITPFNFPLNLVAHKVAPAIAMGCPFVLKPASRTPIGALLIGEILAAANLPPGAFSILPCSVEDADLFATDDRLKFLSFTGSPAVGWDLKKKSGKKKVCLELGGNAAVVVDSDTELPAAIERIIVGAFYQSGQSCISVQRILVHKSIFEEFRSKLVARTKTLKVGDPKQEDTFVGPLIDEKEAERLEKWVSSAVQSGGKLLCGGKRSGPMMEATLLENVPRREKICSEEAFGPVAVLEPFSDFDDALKAINESVYGLQAGIFTRDIRKIQKAWDELEVGGVVIGDIPSFRVDHMPYGGVKNSGLGREGIRFAMDEMSEKRLLVIRA